jgi:hypothetical protein
VLIIDLIKIIIIDAYDAYCGEYVLIIDIIIILIIIDAYDTHRGEHVLIGKRF